MTHWLYINNEYRLYINNKEKTLSIITVDTRKLRQNFNENGPACAESQRDLNIKIMQIAINKSYIS